MQHQALALARKAPRHGGANAGAAARDDGNPRAAVCCFSLGTISAADSKANDAPFLRMIFSENRWPLFRNMRC
jgi:hypothetical protein